MILDVEVVAVAGVVKFGGGGQQKASTLFMGAQSFLLFVIHILIVLKVSARDFFVGGVVPVVDIFVLLVSAFSVVQIISASGSNSCSEFVKGSIPIRQSSSYSGMCFLNQRFESPDQRSKSDHFFLSTGVISLTRSRSLVSDSGCIFSSGICAGVSVRGDEQVFWFGIETKHGARKCLLKRLVQR